MVYLFRSFSASAQAAYFSAAWRAIPLPISAESKETEVQDKLFSTIAAGSLLQIGAACRHSSLQRTLFFVHFLLCKSTDMQHN
jgi:hypothetical protein